MKTSSIINKKYRLKNPEKSYAHSVVNWALRKGKIRRMDCEVCGNTKTQAHHDNYSKPLDVRWLCAPCHESAHHGSVEIRNEKARQTKLRGVARRCERLKEFRKQNPKPRPSKRILGLEKAETMRKNGASYTDIALAIGASKSAVYKWINKTKYQ